MGHPDRQAAPCADQIDQIGDVPFMVLAEADQGIAQVPVAHGGDRQSIGADRVVVELEEIVQLADQGRLPDARGVNEGKERIFAGEGAERAGHVGSLIWQSPLSDPGIWFRYPGS